MNTSRLRLLAIIIPFLFGAGLALLRYLVFPDQFAWTVEALSLALIAGGAALFSTWIFRLIELREDEIRRRTEQLSALNEASLVLTMELDLNMVLNRVVNLACELVSARYGALGVLDEEGKIANFISTGISPEDRTRIGAPPVGDGILGAVMRERMPIRLNDLEGDPRKVGFPSGHPEMHSFLGVPVQSKGRIIGNLYLTDKRVSNDPTDNSHQPFTREDQRIVEMFATQAAIAIENAQLYRKTQQLAVLQERERFGMDLHDGIIQSIYAIGLNLEDTLIRMRSEPKIVEKRLSRTLKSLNNVIRDIRNYILDLRPQRFQGKDLKRGVEELIRELQANTFLNVSLDLDGYDPKILSKEQTVEILHIVQEALTNIRKHARASQVGVELAFDDETFLVTVHDDGIGLDISGPQTQQGNGLRNMHERASVLNGRIEFAPVSPTGTAVLLTVPIE